jgi:AcrR family transcriptional regulator
LRGRVGRPPKALAGDIEERILDAAHEVFLERGFDGASIDEIAERAPASKPTIYARYSGKPALFAAVVSRVVNELMTLDSYATPAGTLQEKLVGLAIAIVDRTLKESLGLLRVTIGEAYRFPDLSSRIHEVSRKRAGDAVAPLLADTGVLATSGRRAASSKAPAAASADIFIDLIILPVIMRSLLGESERTIRKELPGFVRERVKLFLTLHARPQVAGSAPTQRR